MTGPHVNHAVQVVYPDLNNPPLYGEGVNVGGIVLPEGLGAPNTMNCIECGQELQLGVDYTAEEDKTATKEPWQS